MKYTFPYTQFHLWYRPIIPITLRYKKTKILYYALLDSGSDFNIFHADVAKLLKIDLSQLKGVAKFSGIHQGVESEGKFTNVDIGIKNTFSNAPIIFSNNISPNGFGILGQQGFFNKYKISFNYSLKEIVIQN